jgi:hypothetical protein
MKELKYLLVIVLIISLIASCVNNKQTVDPVVTSTPSTGTAGSGTTTTPTITCNPTVVTNTKDSVCFNSQILPFFTTNCASSGCHDSKTRAEGYDLSTYKSIISKGIDLKTPRNSKIYTQMLSEMPPAPAPKLAKSQTDLVLKWITEGAKNVTCGITVDTANVTFSKTIKPLLETNCVGCHKTGSVSGGVILDSYVNVKAYVDNNKMWGAVNYLSSYLAMPPSQKLTDCQLLVVKKWIDKGAKND